MKYFDILGSEPTIFIFGEKRFKTVLGSVMSVLTLSLILSFVIYFSLELLNRKKIYVLSSEKINYNHQIKLHEFPIMFKLVDALGNNFQINTIFPLLTMWYYYPENLGKPNITKILYEKCDINKHFGNYRDLYLEFLDLNTYYCVPPNKFNLTLFGKEGDSNKGFSKMSFHILRCNNNSASNPMEEKITCDSKESTTKILSGLTPTLLMGLIDYELDHANNTRPLKPYVRMEKFIVSPEGNYKHNNYLKKVIYRSDNGYFFEEYDTYEGYQSDSIRTELLLGSSFINPDAFGLCNIYIPPAGYYHERSYAKLQQLIANTGGMANTLMILARLLVGFFSNRLMLIKYANETIDFTNSTKGSKLIHSINPSSKMMIHVKPIIYNNTFKGEHAVNEAARSHLKQIKINADKPINDSIKFRFQELFYLSICLQKNKNYLKLLQAEKSIKKSLSTDNMLILMNQFENLKTIILDEKQIFLFNNFRKKKFDSYLQENENVSELEKIISNLNQNNQIDKKFIEMLKLNL